METLGLIVLGVEFFALLMMLLTFTQSGKSSAGLHQAVIGSCAGAFIMNLVVLDVLGIIIYGACSVLWYFTYRNKFMNGQ